MRDVKVLAMLAVSLLAAMVAAADPNPQMKVDFARWLTPEKCGSADPAALFQKSADDKQMWASEQGQDVFYEVYAEVLAKRNDAFFGEAQKFRKLLSNVSAGIAEFLAQADGKASPKSATASSRAEIEWWIRQGFEKNFDPLEPPAYTHDDLRQLARIYQRSHAHRVKKGRDLSGLEAKVLDPALAELEAGEKEMSKEQILFFRAKLASMIVMSL